MKSIKQIFIALALLSITQVMAEPIAGKDYTLVNPAQSTNTGKNIEVLEFFFYGCSHCYKLHPFLDTWEKNKVKDVELVFVPTIFSAPGETMARTHYALEALGQRKKLEVDLYKAWNVNNQDLRTADNATDFVVQHGVDRKQFSEAYNAFSTESKVMRSKQMVQSYGIRGTPTVIVDGKYLITGLHPADTIKVLDSLVEKVRKERAGKR